MQEKLNNIIKSMEEVFVFAKDHYLATVDLNKANIFSTEIRLKDFLNEYPSQLAVVYDMIDEKLALMKSRDIIFNYWKTTDGNGYVIKPNEDSSMKEVNEYTLTINFQVGNILA